MLRVPGNAEVLSPDSCRTGAGIFDGRLRYDIKLDYKRMETVRAERGYHGPALVCAIYFTPVAGYIPIGPVIKYLATERRIEIAFVPIAGTRVLVPFRMTIPTPFGLGDAGGDVVRDDRRAAEGGEDELRVRAALVHPHSAVVPAKAGTHTPRPCGFEGLGVAAGANR